MYRFLSNKKVTEETILTSHLSNWIDKEMSEHLVILAIHDTTELDLTGKRSEDKLGCLMYDKQKGFFGSSLKVGEERNPGRITIVFVRFYCLVFAGKC
jgi:hypothetical protein